VPQGLRTRGALPPSIRASALPSGKERSLQTSDPMSITWLILAAIALVLLDRGGGS